MTRLPWRVLVLVLAAEGSVFAQAQEDTQAWLSAQGEADLTERIDVSVEQELRLGNEAGFDEAHTDLELGYRLSKHFATSAHYRFIALDDEIRHRVAGDVVARARAARLALSYRFRLQATTQENDDTLVPMRHRFKVGVELAHRLEPFAAVEFFYLLSPMTEYRETRFAVGLDWSATSRLDVTAFFMILREANVQAPEENEIVGIGVSYRFWEPSRPGSDAPRRRESPGE